MSWPTAQDYQEAIQNPHLNFEDCELRAGSPLLDRFGLPVVSAGRFATVYSLDCGNRRIAVRCFLQNYPDQRMRYQEIAEQLKSSNLPYTVEIEYIARGILVSGQWFPVLKMEWVDGDPLLEYIEKHRQDKPKLAQFAADWLQMSRRLGYEGIAHGDLQHGNVIVSADRIKLVDYDGMYVPALSGYSSNEVGHGNYQHPKRDSRDFGPYLDNFSSWLIHTSIICLSIDPSLWDQVEERDEFIIFHKRDLEQCQSSQLLDILSKHASQQIRSVPKTLRHLLSMLPDQIPALDDIAIAGQQASLTLEQHFRSVGLEAGASSEQIQEALRVWKRVWASESFQHNRAVARKAAQKLSAMKESFDAISNAGSSRLP